MAVYSSIKLTITTYSHTHECTHAPTLTHSHVNAYSLTDTHKPKTKISNSV
jgi:hypothetical protein